MLATFGSRLVLRRKTFLPSSDISLDYNDYNGGRHDYQELFENFYLPFLSVVAA